VLEFLDLQVTRLIRLSYGPFQLGNLGRGAIAEVSGKVLNEQLGKGETRAARSQPARTGAHADRRR
jgi:23S rRNA pseudouridine2605 synthase